MKILTLQLWALRSSKHSMVVLVLLLLLLHYLPYMVLVGGRPNSNSNFTTRGTETSDPVPVPFFFFSRIFVRVTTVITALFCCLLFFFSWFWGFLVLLAFEQASSTLVPPPNPTQPFVSLITHYTLHIIHHTPCRRRAWSREQASKQTSDTLHFHPKFSWTEERGEEMRGERVCD